MFAIRPILLAIVAGATTVLVNYPVAVGADGTATDAGTPGSAKASAASTPAAVSEPAVPKLSAAQIVDKHVAARGGVQAWKAVQALQLSGKMEAGRGDNIARAQKALNLTKRGAGKASNAEVASANADLDAAKQILLPFTLDLKRPRQMRLEIEFDGKTAVQVFDGEHGWKFRPFLNRSDVEPFTAEESSAESARGDIEGPLVDYAAKGTLVEVEGSDLVEGQPAYRLKVTAKGGSAKHMWIDAKSFLDIKVEGVPKRMDGKLRPVYVYQRDFRPVQGVIIPFVLETAVEGYTETHKLLVEKAAINPALDDATFAKPHA